MDYRPATIPNPHAALCGNLDRALLAIDVVQSFAL